MLTFLDFVLLVILAIVLMINLFLATGITYTKDGYVSIIKKGKKFYKLETNKFSYYFPIMFHKAGYYPIKPSEYKINNKKVMLYVKDPMLLYKNKINLNKLIRQNKNLEVTFKKYQIIVKK